MPRASLVAASGLAAVAACASNSHDGYPEEASEPWAQARELSLDDRGEAEVVAAVSYPARERARWYAVQIPAPGSLKARLAPVTFGRDDPAELGIELYDEGFELLTAGEGRQPGGDLTHEVAEIDPGQYLVHVYATERDGAADYTLRLSFSRRGEAGSEAFPDSVAFVGELAAVPEVDDTPRRPARRPRTRRPSREPQAEAMAARIAGISVIDNGTRVRINRGANHGVAEGWRGKVTSASGRPIPKGDFTIDRVTARESFGTVSASIDAVTSARHVRIEPP